MRLGTLAVGLSLLLVSLACMTKTKMNAIMDSWVGSSEADLIAAWGPPQQVMSDGQSGKVFIYSHEVTYRTPATSTTVSTGTATATTYGYGNTATAYGYGTGRSSTVYNPSQTYSYTKQRIFFINDLGRVYRWSWRGL